MYVFSLTRNRKSKCSYTTHSVVGTSNILRQQQVYTQRGRLWEWISKLC